MGFCSPALKSPSYLYTVYTTNKKSIQEHLFTQHRIELLGHVCIFFWFIIVEHDVPEINKLMFTYKNLQKKNNIKSFNVLFNFVWLKPRSHTLQIWKICTWM